MPQTPHTELHFTGTLQSLERSRDSTAPDTPFGGGAGSVNRDFVKLPVSLRTFRQPDISPKIRLDQKKPTEVVTPQILPDQTVIEAVF